jgi:glycerol kinase
LHSPQGLLVSPLWLPENSAEEKLYVWEATVNGAASALPYLQRETDLQITPDDINRALSHTPQKTCYLLNAIGGLSAPFWRTDLQPRFSEGLAADEKILAWLESVIFQIVVNVQLMSELGAQKKIYISGGLSNANLVCQKIADLTNTPVYRSDNTDATLQGIACMAAGLPAHWQPPVKDDVFKPQQNSAMQLRFNDWHKEMIKWLQ